MERFAILDIHLLEVFDAFLGRAECTLVSGGKIHADRKVFEFFDRRGRRAVDDGDAAIVGHHVAEWDVVACVFGESLDD